MAMWWVGRLISFAVILQTVELYFVPAWPWRLVAREYPAPLRALVRGYPLWLMLRLAAAILCLSGLTAWALSAVTVMLVTSWLIAVRWRGTFNGGSDVMTFHILLAWWLSLAFPAEAWACLWYIVIQLFLSYFVAGAVKLTRPAWRSGEILPAIVGPRFPLRPGRLAQALAWIIMAFECAIPLALQAPKWSVPLIALGCLFHLANVYVLGLNRFFFAWLAAYPALYYISL